MKFHGNEVVKTDYDVWKSIKSAHKYNLTVFSSFTEDLHAETCYGFKGADYPLMCAESRWDEYDNYKRSNEEHNYYLVVGVKNND